MPCIILCPINNELLTASWCPVYIFMSVSRLQERNCPTQNSTKSSRTAWTPKMRTVWSPMSVSNRYFLYYMHIITYILLIINLYNVLPNRVSSAVTNESLYTRRQRPPTNILFLYLYLYLCQNKNHLDRMFFSVRKKSDGSPERHEINSILSV